MQWSGDSCKSFGFGGDKVCVRERGVGGCVSVTRMRDWIIGWLSGKKAVIIVEWDLGSETRTLATFLKSKD